MFDNALVKYDVEKVFETPSAFKEGEYELNAFIDILYDKSGYKLIMVYDLDETLLIVESVTVELIAAFPAKIILVEYAIVLAKLEQVKTYCVIVTDAFEVFNTSACVGLNILKIIWLADALVKLIYASADGGPGSVNLFNCIIVGVEVP